VAQMDSCGVERCLVVCASVDGNDNLAYVLSAARSHPSRVSVLADLDCPWSSTYHVAGAGDRMRALAEGGGIAGITHYLGRDNDGWLLGADADEVFAEAGRRSLVISLSARPVWQADLRLLAARHPTVPVLCHHLGLPATADLDGPGLSEVTASAAVANILIKASGAHYLPDRAHHQPDNPRPDAAGRRHRALLQRVVDAYGPDRVVWGSDYPACLRYGVTYRQTIEFVLEQCAPLGPEGRSKVMGGTLERLLAAGPGG
jgi:predicted TIM-barrel fold metal-dependent hydrolase